MTIDVRPERGGDAALIAHIVRRAYVGVAHSDHREHHMVERLRATDAFIPALSLIATLAADAVGHVLLTRAVIRRDDAPAVTTLALAPLSVVPEVQGRGIGTALLHQSHRTARRLGFGSILVIGSPDYYPRFGYGPLGRYPIALPFQAPGASCMVLPLGPGTLDGVRGRVEYPPGWLDH